MKIFISWSGTTGMQIAEVISEWLPLVIQGLKPFNTVSDVDKGSKWLQELNQQLAECNFGIACITPQSATSMWLAFEAGALSKQFGAKVATLLFGMKPAELQLPLSMFQATEFKEDDVYKLVRTINSSSPETIRVQEKNLEKTFGMFWPQLNEQIGLTLKSAEVGPAEQKVSVVDVRDQIYELQSQLREQRSTLDVMTKMTKEVLSHTESLATRGGWGGHGLSSLTPVLSSNLIPNYSSSPPTLVYTLGGATEHLMRYNESTNSEASRPQDSGQQAAPSAPNEEKNPRKER